MRIQSWQLLIGPKKRKKKDEGYRNKRPDGVFTEELAKEFEYEKRNQ